MSLAERLLRIVVEPVRGVLNWMLVESVAEGTPGQRPVLRIAIRTSAGQRSSIIAESVWQGTPTNSHVPRIVRGFGEE